jgi:hypothetical protein
MSRSLKESTCSPRWPSLRTQRRRKKEDRPASRTKELGKSKKSKKRMRRKRRKEYPMQNSSTN